VVGSESGYLYLYNKDGQVINKDGQVVKPDNREEVAISTDGRVDSSCSLFKCAQAINQISITPDEAADIILASEDRHIYALSRTSCEQIWQSPFPTDGWARCVFACHLNNEETVSILVSTANRYLYWLDRAGHKEKEILLEYPARALLAADINRDGIVEILVATDKHELIALKPNFEPLWSCNVFANRLRALYVVDIDRDGTDEIIAGGDDKHLYILDTQGKILWRHFLGARIVSLCASDIDGDGIQEVIVGAADDRVYVAPESNLGKGWSVRANSNGVSNICREFAGTSIAVDSQ